jgi:hypothetical protein
LNHPKEQVINDELRRSPVRLTPLEEAFARQAIRKQTADHQRAELQDAANRATIRMAESLTEKITQKITPDGLSSHINEAALRKFAALQRRKCQEWPDIKQAASSRFPGLRPDDPVWGRIQNAIRQRRSRAKA